MVSDEIRMKQKLREQLGFLQRSCESFDQGHEDEAYRIATSIRVLIHDTSRSESLLKHLNIKNTKMLSSARGHGNWKDYLQQEIDLKSFQPVRMIPILEAHFRHCSMHDWWERESVFIWNGRQFPRKMIVLSMANKDGGAHVDSQLEEYYEILLAGEWAIGITGNLEFKGKAPFPQGVLIPPSNGHLALMRQIAHEVLASANHHGWLNS